MNWKTRTYPKEGTTVVTLEHEHGEDGPFVFDGTLYEVLEALEKIKEQIPEEYWTAATCELSGVNRYDVVYGTIEVTYTRPATQSEIDAVNETREQREHAERTRELAQLAALQQKYGK